ncbi:MAG: NAD(P)/FAD-dependent oxidoreductase [Alkalispirochaeta sp.]
MSRKYDVVVIGAGSAGNAAAAEARTRSDTSSILLVNGEEYPPYDRRRLSKTIYPPDTSVVVPLEDDGWFAEREIERIDGSSGTSIDREHGTVTVNGETIAYGTLVLATGADPLFPKLVRPHERGSFFVVRTARDVEELRSAAARAKNVLIAGMGVLAVEIAQELTRWGKRVTLAGATAQLMPRQLSARASELLEEAMIGEKVKLLFQEEIISFEENRKHSWTVEMLKHTSHYDLVVFCIGVQPRIALARDAGLDVNTGILVDQQMRTGDERIFAAGDCAQLPDGHISYLWEEAAAQGRVAGANAVGSSVTYDGAGFPLHTTVFGIDLFSVGNPRKPWYYRIDEFEVESRYYAYYWNDNILHGAIILNDPDRIEQVPRAVREGWTRSRVADELGIG